LSGASVTGYYSMAATRSKASNASSKDCSLRSETIDEDVVLQLTNSAVRIADFGNADIGNSNSSKNLDAVGICIDLVQVCLVEW
jgi:hypothetical protein